MSHLAPAVSWGSEDAGENHALTPFSAGDVGVIGVATLLKASLVQSSATHLSCSGGNPRSGYSGSDDDDALALLYLLRTSFLDQRWLVEARGGVVFIYRVADDESQWRGAAGSR
jgi:hypothetical protein